MFVPEYRGGGGVNKSLTTELPHLHFANVSFVKVDGILSLIKI